MKFKSSVILIALSALLVVMAVVGCSQPPVEQAPLAGPTAATGATEPTQAAAAPAPAVTTAVEATSAPTIAATTAAPTTAPTTVPTTAATATTAPATTAGVTVTDGAGREVTIAGVPERIISLAPSTTEIVCALGACDKLVGIDQFSDYPAEVKSKPIVSDGFNPNYEQIVASKPDLVLAAAVIPADAVKKIEELKLPLIVVGAETASFDHIKSDIELVGKALGAEDQAAQVVSDMVKQIQGVTAAVAKSTDKPRVFWELDATDPAKPFTVGPGSFVDQIITTAGGVNIASNATSPYPQLNAEEVIRMDPQVIILSDAAYGISPESVGQRPGWNVISAVKDNKVFPIDDNLVSRPGPRVGLGLEAAAKLIHPELFSTEASTQTAITDLFAYCAMPANANTLATEYDGKASSPTLLKALGVALGSPDTPADFYEHGTYWRCMAGKVYACFVGANIPCESKADVATTPGTGSDEYCKENPNADFIPAFATGHSTVFEWSCKNGRAQVGKQIMDVDAQGYPVPFWYEIKPQ